MILKCPHCLSTRHDLSGGDGARCLRCKKDYYFEKTDSGKSYRYFFDSAKEVPLLLKDASYEEDIPPGMWLYGVKHPITREYRNDIIAVDREDAIKKTGWDLSEIPPDAVIQTIPIRKGPELKEEKERKKKEKGKPTKPKREGPSLKEEIITFTKSIKGIAKEQFVEGVLAILTNRMLKDNKPIDKAHLLKRSKLYWSMYGKNV